MNMIKEQDGFPGVCFGRGVVFEDGQHRGGPPRMQMGFRLWTLTTS